MKKALLMFLVSLPIFVGASEKEEFDYSKNYKGYLLKGEYFHPDVIGAIKIFEKTDKQKQDYHFLVQEIGDKARIKPLTYNKETVLVISH